MTEFINQDGESFGSLQALIQNELNVLDDENEQELDYAKWIVDNKDYYPAPTTKITDKLPNGVYKLIETRDDIKITPYEINTDELYIFSEDFTSQILDEVKSFWNKEETYKKYNITHKRGILLCGPPGCGKTSIINLLIKQITTTDGLVFMVSNARDFQTLNATIKPIVRKIEPNRPIITIIEDINQLIEEMGGTDYQLLDFMDGKGSIDNHLIIMTTNDTSDLSEALLRPSRIDLTYEIPYPNDRIRKEFFEKKGIEEDKIIEYVKQTKNMTFAQLKEVFIGTKVLGKDLKKVIERINTPFESKDYLGKTKQIKGL